MFYYAKLYSQIVRKEVARYFTYRANLFSGALYAVLALAMRYTLWQALYRTGNAQGASFAETMTFFVVSDALFRLFGVSCCDIIGPDIRTGDLANRLGKPYPYQFMVFSLMGAFNLTRWLTQGAVMLILGFAVVGIAAPATPAGAMSPGEAIGKVATAHPVQDIGVREVGLEDILKQIYAR